MKFLDSHPFNLRSGFKSKVYVLLFLSLVPSAFPLVSPSIAVHKHLVGKHPNDAPIFQSQTKFGDSSQNELILKSSYTTNGKRISRPSFLPHNTQLRMANFPFDAVFGKSDPVVEEVKPIKITHEIGSGSYGTVYLCNFLNDAENDPETMIAKRAWTERELEQRAKDAAAPGQSSNDDGLNTKNDGGDDDAYPKAKSFKDRAIRCAHYLDVEKHCFEKIQLRDDSSSVSNNNNSQIPNFVGSYPDENGLIWLVFSMVKRRQKYTVDGKIVSWPAMTLNDAIKVKREEQPNLGNNNNDDDDLVEQHHLWSIQDELGLPEKGGSSFGYTLDTVLGSILSALSEVHKSNIVHRDLKPANLLLDPATSSVFIIDFGSAADIDPDKSFQNVLLSSIGLGSGGRIGLESTTIAISPIYAAPELFVDPKKAPLNFDVFSTAMIFFQLLFNLIDDRTEAAFRQQVEDAKYDLDSWLDRELLSKIRPSGLDNALGYFAERPGLWQLLKDMMYPDPEMRVSSLKACVRLKAILNDASNGISNFEDGPFFESVISSFDRCEIPSLLVADGADDTVSSSEGGISVYPRPLHFVASFDRKKSIGLILSEKDDDSDSYDLESLAEWERATASATPGEVYVRGIASLGQADKMGIFEIGDRLRAVGELPLSNGGFEEAVDMISRQPQSSKTVKLHFDRIPRASETMRQRTSPHLAKLVGQGVWSSKGRRKAQEDAFVLHEIHDDRGNNVLMAGVFDGHGGMAASTSVSQILPSIFASELSSITERSTVSQLRESLNTAWESTSDTYRSGCDIQGECVADYDPIEGVILASTGSEDLIAGTTAVAAVMSVGTDGGDELIILNCGDSRALLVGSGVEDGQNEISSSSVVYFSTRDHSPKDEREEERLQSGKGRGLGYSLPECSLGRWYLTIGDYQYAVSRSLEGTFATSKGIVSNADVSSINLPSFVAERENACLLLASDGLFEVIDNEQVGRELISMRMAGFTAADAAKNLCETAINKYCTSDNVSIIVIYFE